MSALDGQQWLVEYDDGGGAQYLTPKGTFEATALHARGFSSQHLAQTHIRQHYGGSPGSHNLQARQHHFGG